MKCIECEEAEAVGGFYCAGCSETTVTQAERASLLQQMAERYGPVRYCRKPGCGMQYRDKAPWQNFCVNHRRKG